MSQQKKRDIADFFRPHARTIPRKRSTLEPDADTIIVNIEKASPSTPSTSQTVKQHAFGSHAKSPATPKNRPLATPKSGRNVAIPVRSAATPATSRPVSTKRAPLFELSNKQPDLSPRTSSSFSFADAPPYSNCKVIEDGQLVAIRDSDDEDNESLESLDDIFSRNNDTKKSFNSSQSSKKSSNNEDERVKMLNLFTEGRSNSVIRKDKLRELQRMEQANKIDLSFLYEESRKEAELEARIAQANVEIEEATKEIEDSKQAELDKKMIEAILTGSAGPDADSDDIAKAMGAIERTEALSGEQSFSFFGRSGPIDISSQTRSTKRFPSSSTTSSLWDAKDSGPRERSYLSGFMTELAGQGKLEDEVLRWTFDSILTEQNCDLRQSYINCVSQASFHWTRNNVTPEDIGSIFGTLGTDTEVLRDGSNIEAHRRHRKDVKRDSYKHLVVALKLLHSICQDMDFATLSKLTSMVSRLCLDQRTMSNNQVRQAAEDLLAKLVDPASSDSRDHVHERLLSDLASNLKEPALQALFLQHSAPTTSTAGILRQRLASTFLGSNRTTKQTNPSSVSTEHPLTTIAEYLKDSDVFSLVAIRTSPTNFALLGSLTSILDAAIADGHPPFQPTRVEEQMYNHLVDDIADHIHELFTSIPDSGASHMTRTEAKDALQALHYRLLYGVRTKIRRKKHVFDAQGTWTGKEGIKGRIRDADEFAQERRGKNFMDKFFDREANKEPHLLPEQPGSAVSEVLSDA